MSPPNTTPFLSVKLLKAEEIQPYHLTQIMIYISYMQKKQVMQTKSRVLKSLPVSRAVSQVSLVYLSAAFAIILQCCEND